MKNTRQKILDAALKLFVEKSYESVGIREIAKKAGVNSSLISYYFGGKANLYRELLFMHFDEFVRSVNALCFKSKDELEFLREFIKLHIRILRKRGRLGALLMLREFAFSSDFGEELRDKFLSEIGKKVIDRLEVAKGKGRLREIDSEVLLGFMVHTNVMFAVRFLNMDEETASQLAFELFMKGVGT